ncbi:unnamed protein product, partial [Discosporangium mesarthrocarpum]
MSFLKFQAEDALQLKRNKQAAFRATLDQQRLEKQKNGVGDVSQTARHDASATENVSGLPGPNIPGLETGRIGYYGPGVGAFGPESGDKSRQAPYMSALAEMNGKPLHIRQQQYEKESQYRKMLREQIEANTRRKEAEKARLEQEKRKELQDLKHSEAINSAFPRRQQHAEFQESPDHPMPSPSNLYLSSQHRPQDSPRHRQQPQQHLQHSYPNRSNRDNEPRDQGMPPSAHPTSNAYPPQGSFASGDYALNEGQSPQSQGQPQGLRPHQKGCGSGQGEQIEGQGWARRDGNPTNVDHGTDEEYNPNPNNGGMAPRWEGGGRR